MKISMNKFMLGCISIALVSGFAACNGSDSAETTKDSVSAAATAAKTADSTAAVKAKKKKKGLTSVAAWSADSTKMARDVHGVYNHAEKMPEYPGGQSALATYINKNITYPETAVTNGTSGTIQVQFIVDEHGKVMDPQVINGAPLGDGLSDETLTAFNKMPNWTPGTVHGKKVKTRMVLPVKFELADADQ